MFYKKNRACFLGYFSFSALSFFFFVRVACFARIPRCRVVRTARDRRRGATPPSAAADTRGCSSTHTCTGYTAGAWAVAACTTSSGTDAGRTAGSLRPRRRLPVAAARPRLQLRPPLLMMNRRRRKTPCRRPCVAWQRAARSWRVSPCQCRW